MKITKITSIDGIYGSIDIFYDEEDAIGFLKINNPEMDVEAMIADVVNGKIVRFDEGLTMTILRQWEFGDDEAAKDMEGQDRWNATDRLKIFAEDNGIDEA